MVLQAPQHRFKTSRTKLHPSIHRTTAKCCNETQTTKFSSWWPNIPPVMKIAADRNVKESLKRCLKTILQLVELDVIELWTRGQNGFSLHYIYRNDIPNSSDCNRSGPNDEESIKLCEKSIDSTDGFFFTVSKVDPRFSSRICLHLPRENVNADVFFVGYSTESRQVIPWNIIELPNCAF